MQRAVAWRLRMVGSLWTIIRPFGEVKRSNMRRMTAWWV
jgi:hypothetical protein